MNITFGGSTLERTAATTPALNGTEFIRYVGLLDQPLSQTSRYFAILWSIVTAIFSIMGNLTVLVASIRYNAVTIDRISVTLLKHLAASDCGYGIFIILTLGYIIGEDNIYGDIVCYIITALSFYIMAVESIFLSLLNLSKLYCMICPLRSAVSSSRRKGHLICCIVWVVVAVQLSTSLYLARGSPIVYLPAALRCMTMKSSSATKIFALVSTVVVTVIPFLVISVSAISLLYLVKRTNGSFHKRNLIALISISTVYFLSFMPTSLVMILRRIPAYSRNSWMTRFYKAAFYAVHANFAANPLIYFLTIRSFGLFVRAKWRNICRCIFSFIRSIRFTFWESVQLGLRNIRSDDEETSAPHDEITDNRNVANLEMVIRIKPSRIGKNCDTIVENQHVVEERHDKEEVSVIEHKGIACPVIREEVSVIETKAIACSVIGKEVSVIETKSIACPVIGEEVSVIETKAIACPVIGEEVL